MTTLVKWMAGASVLMLLTFIPFQVEQGKPSYPRAHALVGKMILWAVKHEAKKMIGDWLKTVAKAEGKRVALAAVKSLKALPNDQNFRLAVIAALAGGNYAQAADFTKRRSVGLMKAGARDQWETDKQKLSDHPEIAFQSFGRSAGETVEGQWNTADDIVTCGKNNIDITSQSLHANDPYGEQRYTVADMPHDNLLTGRALLQRILFKSMMRNTSFQSPERAERGAEFYSHLACVGGKSRKVTAFLGGLALHGKAGMIKLKDAQVKSLQFMDKMDRWAKKKL